MSPHALEAGSGENHALAETLVRYVPRGAVRAAEALAATALNRRRRAARVWKGVFANAVPSFGELFGTLAVQPLTARADAAWTAACRRIAARALAGAGPDPAGGAHHAAMREELPPTEFHASVLTAEIGPFAFYRDEA
jgi:N-acetylmuramoyl-L-alanine amidase